MFNNPGLWLDVLQTLVIVLLWLRKPGEDAKLELHLIRTQIGVFEERIKHMPTNTELSELEGTFKAMTEKVAGMEDMVKTTRAGVQRIEDFLRHNR